MEYIVLATADAANRAKLANLAPQTRFTKGVGDEATSIVFLGAKADEIQGDAVALVFRSLYREEIVRYLARYFLERDFGCRDVLVQKVVDAGRVGGPQPGRIEKISALSLLNH
jgi:hypothetical protein